MSKHIDISVNARFLDSESQPEKSQYVYAYDITIKNTGETPAQLISRYWHIEDSNQCVQEVQGMGVIGQQPRLQPGQSYRYSSGVVLETEAGLMQGHYVMSDDDGVEFEAAIPQFALVKPSALH